MRSPSGCFAEINKFRCVLYIIQKAEERAAGAGFPAIDLNNFRRRFISCERIIKGKIQNISGRDVRAPTRRQAFALKELFSQKRAPLNQNGFRIILYIPFLGNIKGGSSEAGHGGENPPFSHCVLNDFKRRRTFLEL